MAGPCPMNDSHETGRVAELTELHLDDTWLLALDPSMQPRWYEGADGHQRWHDQYDGPPCAC